MEIKVYMDDGNVLTYKPTFLSYPDGFAIEADELDVADVKGRGVRYVRRAFTEDGGGPKDLGPARVLVPPQEVPRVLLVKADGEIILESDGWGGLTNPVLDCLTKDAELSQECEDLRHDPLVVPDGTPSELLARLDDAAAARLGQRCGIVDESADEGGEKDVAAAFDDPDGAWDDPDDLF